MRLSFHKPVGALGIVLIFGIAASVMANALLLLGLAMCGVYAALARRVR